MKLTFFLSGGAGFIGSHLSEHLLGLGHRVIVMDDLSTGSIHNIEHLKANKNFSYTIDSITNKPLTAELLDRSDVVIHLAAAVGVRLIVESPVRTIETNVRGTEAILEIACKKKKPVVVASTSEVYGKSTDTPFSEDGDLVIGATTRGRWSYACSKALDEFLAIAYFRERKLPTVVLRFFNTVGPRQTGRYGMVIPRFVQQAITGVPITVYGNGQQSRCFCHVRDVVKAITQTATRSDAYGNVYNVGNTHEISIMDLAERIRSRANSRSEIITVPYDEAYDEGFEDMPRRVPSIDKIQRLIGWLPEHSLEQIIDDVIQFEKSALSPN